MKEAATRHHQDDDTGTNHTSLPACDTTLYPPIQFFLFALFGGIAIYVASYAIYQTYIYHTAIPQWDEWRVLSNYKSMLDGKTSLISFLWSLHNEHRVLVPRIILIGDIHLFNGAVVLPKLIMFLAIALHLAVFVILLVQHVEASQLLRFFLSCGIAVIFFSSQQLENYVRGFNNQVFLVTLFTTLSLYCIYGAKLSYSRGQNEVKGQFFALGSVVFAVLSTYSMASGVLTWPLLIFYAWYIGIRRSLLMLILVAGIATVATYLWQFTIPSYHSDPFQSIFHIRQVIIFSLMFLGNIVGMFGPQASFVTGLIGLLILGLIIYGHVAQRKSISDVSMLLVLIALSAVLVSYLVALGRLKFDASLSSRYVTFTAPFWASVITLAFSSPKRFGLKLGLSRMLFVMLTASLISAIVIRQDYMKQFGENERIQYEKGGMALFLGVRDPVVVTRLNRNLSMVEDVNLLLFTRHLPPHTERWVALTGQARKVFSKNTGKNGNWCIGFLDVITPIGSTEGAEQWYRVEGWAWNKKTTKAPDLILLVTSESPSGIGKVFIPRDDVIRAEQDVTNRQVGWFGYARQVSNEEVTAYAFSKDQSTLCKLSMSSSLIRPGHSRELSR